MVKYFYADPVPLEKCTGGTRAAVKLNLGDGSTALYVFIKDGQGAEEDHTFLKAKLNAQKAWDAFCKDGTEDLWLNNHDAFPTDLIRYDEALNDGIICSPEVLRLQVPYTLWTIELVAPANLAGLIQGSSGAGVATTACRDFSVQLTYKKAWRKSTFMVSDSLKALKFAIDILGAVQIQSPYPWPPVENCTVALWGELANDVQLHFVESPTWLLTEMDERVAGGLASGTWDRLMYNSLILSVDSLDPFVERLQARGSPFFITRIGSELSLFAEMPGNAVTVQLRSSHVSNAEPVPMGSETCMENF
jgi:hypothetical protein